ncbi:MAG: class I SAM-dependent methyltransferase [Anaerolineales bacterium]|nr:class I SAM-dependent methyltransferase [Anaerolineales bacterium]
MTAGENKSMMMDIAKIALIDEHSIKHWGVTDEEGRHLGWLASQVPKGGLIVEIGTLYGRSTSFIAIGAKKDVRVYAVDCWEGTHYHRMIQAVEYFTKLDLMSKIKIIKGYSTKVAKSFKGSIDMLYIDGDHAYESVKADYNAWHPFIAKGGIVAFHDHVLPKYPGIVKFVTERASKEYEFIAQIGKVWSGKKK